MPHSHPAHFAPVTPRFPFSRVLLARTRLAYVHLPNLLNDAKRDRSARISGYVAISLPEESVIIYLLGGEVANATVRDGKGARAVAIASALQLVPEEAEYGEICFHEADPEQLGCMFVSQSRAADPWPSDIKITDPAALFPYLSATTYDGTLEILAHESANYVTLRDGNIANAYLTGAPHGTVPERVNKLFAREGRASDIRVSRWPAPALLPVQAPAALVQAYRELTAGLVQRLVAAGSANAPALAEQARQKLLSTHPSLEAFSGTGRAVKQPVADTQALTADIAAWIRDLVWVSIDHEEQSPVALLKELTWERRHMFQSAGLFDQMPWKVM
jgi:hypothetical protein